ncbi:alpha/beta hydrolase, partial [Streptomyces sp. Wh19]|nr:alpha/beta hydrolase [Streptomyces sp. Wh19]
MVPDRVQGLRSRPAGEATDDGWDAVAPFFYGRWDGAARAHAAADAEQSDYGAADRCAAPGAFD